MIIQTLFFIIAGLIFVIIGTWDKDNDTKFFGAGFIVASVLFSIVLKIIEVQFP